MVTSLVSPFSEKICHGSSNQKMIPPRFPTVNISLDMVHRRFLHSRNSNVGLNLENKKNTKLIYCATTIDVFKVQQVCGCDETWLNQRINKVSS